MDRNALRLARGGPTVGDIATHCLPPGMGGFDEAGGMKGTGVDFLSADGKPNLALAAEYLKKAGFASGKYEGTDKILMVGSNVGVAGQDSPRSAKENFEKLGLQDDPAARQPQTMYTKLLQHPRGQGGLCPNVGWGKDFADGQTMLDPIFNGKNILPQAQQQLAELNDAGDQRRDRRREARLRSQGARCRLGRDRQATSPQQAAGVPWLWDKQPADPVRERQRRHHDWNNVLGSRLDVAEVSSQPFGGAPHVQ